MCSYNEQGRLSASGKCDHCRYKELSSKSSVPKFCIVFAIGSVAQPSINTCFNFNKSFINERNGMGLRRIDT